MSSKTVAAGFGVFWLVVACVLMSVATAQEKVATETKVEVEFPPPGTKWVTRTADHAGATSIRTSTVLEGGSYEGKPVYRVSDGTDVRVFDKATTNWIATLRDGKERFAASPNEGVFSPPLQVGKWWKASYTYYDRGRGRSWSPIETTWKVEAYEDVTVPAGTFKAFKLQSTPGRNDATYTIIWYAPEVKLIIKRVSERTLDHSLGPGKFVTELIEYQAK